MKSSDFVFIENVTELSCEFIHNASNLSAAFSIELLGISFVEWVASLQLKKIVHKKTSLEQVEQLANHHEISMYEIIKDANLYGLNRIYLKSRKCIYEIEVRFLGEN